MVAVPNGASLIDLPLGGGQMLIFSSFSQFLEALMALLARGSISIN